MLSQFDMEKIENSFLEMPMGEPFVCSFSGGKDSAIALAMAMEKGKAKGLVHWYDGEKNTSIFHSQDFSIINCQAQHIGLPLIVVHYTPWKHRLQLLRTYQEMKKKGEKSIVFGDINICDSVKIQSILCEEAGLIPRYPLWNKDYDWMFTEMQKRKIKAIITRVNTSMLEARWLGQTFNENVYQQFKNLAIDSFGERGEYHTTVVNADFFLKEIEFTFYEDRIGNKLQLKLSSHYHEKNIYRLI